MKIGGLRLMNIEKDILRLMNIEEDILHLMNIEEDILHLMNIEEEDIWAKLGGYHRVRGQESQMRKSENVFKEIPFLQTFLRLHALRGWSYCPHTGWSTDHGGRSDRAEHDYDDHHVDEDQDDRQNLHSSDLKQIRDKIKVKSI